MHDFEHPPAEFAKVLLEWCSGNAELAQCELFEYAKADPLGPNEYWRDCFLEIIKLADGDGEG